MTAAGGLIRGEEIKTEGRLNPMTLRARELTKREREVVALVANGYKNREMAEKMGFTVKMVESHRENIMKKLALRNVAQLIRYAIQKGMVSVKFEE